MDAPSASDVKGWSQSDLITGATPARLAQNVAIAISTFKKITGQSNFEVITEDDTAMVQRAITGLAEMVAQQSDPDYLEELSDWDLISSFSAGPYSETRRSPDEARKARLIVAWPWLSDLLWGLLTPDQYDWWVMFFSGVNAPAFAVTEVDWRAGDGYGGSYQYDPRDFFGA